MYEIIPSGLLEEYNKFVKNESLLPVKVSDFYLKKVEEEIASIGYNGPLYLTVMPNLTRLRTFSSHESRDYVEDYNHLPVANSDYIIKKYNDRVLFLVSDDCVSHCQYCFRQYNLSRIHQAQEKDRIIQKVKVLKAYLLEHPEIKEVILSGGDPLTLDYDTLSYILDELNSWDIRLHTRAIVFNPFLFTDRIIKLFGAHHIRLVFHISHPYEICDTVKEFLSKIESEKIHMYAQFPLLRGINDDWRVLYRLLSILDSCHVRPISIFIPDPLKYGASYRIEFNRISKIIDELNWNTPSWINSIRVVLDTPCGKARRENVVSQSGRKITFFREGKYIDYYDLDEGIDCPSNIDVLLWKG